MKTHALGLALLIATTAAATMAGSYPGSLSTESLAEAPMQRVTIGADIVRIGRTIEVDSTVWGSLQVTTYTLFLGYDLFPAMTVFGTVGGTDDQTFQESEANGDGSSLAWSLGANVNLLEYGIRHPVVVNQHRVTMRLIGEWGSVEADSSEWTAYSIALPLTYEIVERGKFTTPKLDDRFVLAIYAGPLLSALDGELTVGGIERDFEEDKIFGLVAGADLYLTRHVAFGGHVELFDQDDDEITGGGSFRYHF